MNETWNSNYNDEKTISLLDLMFYMLRKWRLMLIFAVLAAVLAAAITYTASIKEQKEKQVKAVQQVELAEETKASYQAKVDAIEEHLKNVEEYNYYLDHSIKMKLDPNQYYQGSLKYLLSADQNRDCLKAVAFFEENIVSDETLEALAETMVEQTEPAFLREVVTFSEEADAFAGNVSQDKNETVLVIEMQHYTKDECQKMLEYMAQKMEDLQKQMTKNGMQVHLESMSSDIQTCQNRELVAQSEFIQNEKVRAYAEVKTIEKEMTSKEEKYYDFNKANQEGTLETAAEAAAIKGSINWVYVVAALIMGAVFTAGISALIYLFSDRIHTKEEMEGCICVPVMLLSKEEPKNAIDRMLARLEKRAGDSVQDTVEMAAAMLKKIAEQYDTKTVAMAGSKRVNSDADVVLKLKNLLAEDGITLNVGNSILEDSETLKDAIDCGYVVFFEKCNVSSAKDIRAGVNKVTSCGGKVLGIVLQ